MDFPQIKETNKFDHCIAEFEAMSEEERQQHINDVDQANTDWMWVGYNGNTPADFVFGTLNKTPIR